MEAGLARLLRQPGKRDLAMALCSLYNTNVRLFIWTNGVARLPRSRLNEARSRLPGWKILHINTRKRAGPLAGMII